MRNRDLSAYVGAYVRQSNSKSGRVGVITSVKQPDMWWRSSGPVATVDFLFDCAPEGETEQPIVESLHELTVVGWWRPHTPAC